MNRTLFYPLLLACGLSLSACDTASANSPEFSLEVEYTAIGPGRDRTLLMKFEQADRL